MAWIKRHIDLLIILLTGFVLRLVVSIIHSYSNDELSAVSRLRYTNFSDLIELGVQKGDMHPAGVQVFMKIWSLIFGTSEGMMRFPFVLFGTGAIFVLFLIGRDWFNRRTGLIAAAMLAVLYFPIMNSEFARPYSPGLFITLLVGYFLHKVLFQGKNKLKNSIWLGVFFALGMYTHYFAFLSVGFIGATGLLFLTRQNFKFYILSALIAVILFLPHIGVTIYHLSVGGLQWLGPPENDWLIQFLYHAFNESYVVIITFAAFCIIALWQKNKGESMDRKNLILAVLWFFGVYILGHIMSLISTPVLKFPVMLFVFPFFLILVAIIMSRIPSYKAIVMAILLVGVSSTINEKALFGNQHYALFKESGLKIAEWNETYGEENIYTIYNINNPDYMNFYAEEWGGDSIRFDWHELEFNSDIPIREDLLKRQEEYCVIGFSSRITLVQIFETVREFYPTVVDYEQYNNGAVFLMQKGNRSQLGNEEELAWFSSFADGEWTFNPENIIPTEGVDHYLLDSATIYGPEYHFSLSDLPDWENLYLKAEIAAEMEEGDMLTVAFSGERNGEVIQYRGENMWEGHDLERMILTTTSQTGYFAFKIPDYLMETDDLKISLWNRGGTEIKITSFRITCYENMWN